jgi:hypothetical protein
MPANLKRLSDMSVMNCPVNFKMMPMFATSTIKKG